MAYIGQRPVIGRYIKLDQISSGFNGSNTGFSMTAGSQAVFPGTARNLLLSLGGVIQEPDTDFTISGSTLTFTTPPVANTTFFGVIYGDMQATGTPSDGTVLPASIASSGNFSFPQLTVTTDLTISSASPKIFLTDTGQNPDYTVSNTDGIFKIISSDGGGTDKIKINTDGHVDITGNLDCEAGLDVTGGGLTVNTGAVNTCATFTSSDSGAVINLTDNSARSSIEQNGTDFKIISDTDAGDDNSTIKFQVDASTKMTILSSGNVGIGTVSPNAKLTICETGTLTGGDINLNADGLVIDNNGGNTGITFKTPNSASSRIAFGDPEDNNVGQIVYNHSTDDLTITAADNIVLDGDSVGIGTSSVDRKFHVEGTDNVLLKLQNNQTVCLMEFQDTDTTSGNRPAMGADGNNAVFYTGGVPTMVIDSSGRVGIGTSSLGSYNANADNLVIVDSGHSGISIQSGTSSNGVLAFTDGANTSWQGFVEYEHNGNNLKFGSNGDERMRITSDGLLGINNSANVDAQIDIQGNSENKTFIRLRSYQGGSVVEHWNGRGISNSADTGRLGVGKNGNALIYTSASGSSINAFAIGNSDAKPLIFSTANTERVRIDGSGNTFVNCTSDPVSSNAKFAVQGGGNGLTVATFDFNSDASAANVTIKHGRAGAVSGTRTAVMVRFQNLSGTQIGTIESGISSTAYNTSGSDRTLKKNFEPWNENVLDLFKGINPQKFNFIQEDDGAKKSKGFVAQDMVNSFPEAYTKADENSKYFFNPSGMVVYLMKAIQELEAEVAALKAA